MYVCDHPNAKFLERLYATVLDGFSNPTELEKMLHAHIEEPFLVHGAGATSVGGEYHGVRELIGHTEEMAALSDNTVGEMPFAIVADDTWGLAAQVMKASRGDRRLELPIAGAWRFNSRGMLVEHWELVQDLAVWDAFWGS
jgi:hypothetical protein